MCFLQVNYVMWIAVLISNGAFGLRRDSKLDILRNKLDGLTTVVTSDITLLRADMSDLSRELGRISGHLKLQRINGEQGFISNSNNKSMVQRERQDAFQGDFEELSRRIKPPFSKKKAHMKRLRGEMKQEIGKFGSELKHLIDELRENQDAAEINLGKRLEDIKARAESNTGKHFEVLQASTDKQFTALQTRAEYNIGKLFEVLQGNIDKQFTDLQIRVESNTAKLFEVLHETIDKKFADVEARAESNTTKLFEVLHETINKKFADVEARAESNTTKLFEVLHETIDKTFADVEARAESNTAKQFEVLHETIDKKFADVEARAESNTTKLFEVLHEIVGKRFENLTSSVEAMSNGVNKVKDECVSNVQLLSANHNINVYSKFMDISRHIHTIEDKLGRGTDCIDRGLSAQDDIFSKVKYIEGVYARGRVRIVNITETAETIGGRLEVQYSGRWGTVCDDEFNFTDAKVACRSLGFRGVVAYQHAAYFGRGENDIWFDDVTCDENGTDIFNCDRVGGGRGGTHNCNHGKDVGVICKKNEFVREKVRIVNIIETADTIGGRLEVFFAGRWGTVCVDLFNMTDAKVACRSLGFHRDAIGYSTRDYFGQGENDIWFTEVQCDGTEIDIFNCSRVGGGSPGSVKCDHNEDVGVICQKDEFVRGNVRIVNIIETADTIGGRLEVHYSGRWGTVCDDEFNMTDAKVACRSLGFQRGAVTYKHGAYFGRGENDIWFNGVHCHGSEIDIFGCSRVGGGRPGYVNCDHSKDVGVICQKDVFVREKVRIVNTIETADTIGGRLEVFFPDRWGTVCDDLFTMTDANVACRSLGFHRGAVGYKTYDYFSRGENDIWFHNVQCDGSEIDIFSCSRVGGGSPGSVNCVQSKDVGIFCQKDEFVRENVRIVNITETADTIGGRLEVHYSGRWGTVCDDEFNMTAAKVACRSLGFQRGAAGYKTYDRFRRGENDIWFYNVQCDGSEIDISSCSRVGGGSPGSVNCVHNKNVGIICNKNEFVRGNVRIVNITETTDTIGGRLEVHYSGRWGTVCDDDFDLTETTVACRSLGFHRGAVGYKTNDYFRRGENIWFHNVQCDGSEMDIFNCSRAEGGRDGSVKCDQNEDVGVICQKDEYVRGNVSIVNTTETVDTIGGRLEVHYSGRWGTVCDDNFNMTEANVACRSLGFQRGAVAYKHEAYFGLSENDILMDDVQCNGSEIDIFSCSRVWGGWDGSVNCNNSKGVGVICQKDVLVRGNVSIVNTTETADTIGGRLEVHYSGRWGTVCDNEFSLIEANVACRSLGFQRGAIAYNHEAYFGQSVNDIWFDDVQCNGSEIDIFSCSRVGGGKDGSVNCDHSKDVGVICQKNVFMRGNVIIVNITETADTIGGRLEVHYSGRWGTVCDDDFDMTDAKVACRSLGFQRGAVNYKHGAYFGKGENDIWFDNMQCTGSEIDIFSCSRVGGGSPGSVNCVHNNDVGIICLKDEFVRGNVRIVNIIETADTIGGRLEVHYSGRWGTVCDDDFDIIDANVACRSLGLQPGSVAFKPEAHFGQGKNNIWFDNVQCDGSETHLFACDRIGGGKAGSMDCGHSEDVGVICMKGVFVRGNVRIVNTTETAATIGGRLEVFFAGRWGTVCDELFNMTDAKVACRSLGFHHGAVAYKSHAYFGRGEYDIWFNDAQCDGSEVDIFNCSLVKDGEDEPVNCDHSKDVGIICQKDNVGNGNVRIVNITVTTDTIGGRLEVHYSSGWGTVCDDDFDLTEATVACRSLGFQRGAVAFKHAAYFGQGENDIWFDDVECNGSETNIFDCDRVGSGKGGSMNCDHDEDVGVMCLK